MADRLLVVERHFPYSGGARTESFVQLWPGLGWKVHVITRDPPSTPFPLDVLMERVPRPVEVTRVAVTPPGSRSGLLPPRIRRGCYRLFHRPLPEAEWISPAVAAVRAQMDGQPPDLVYTSSPVESAHEIGHLLSQAWGRPWVMDVRDLFTQYEGRFSALTPLHARWAERLEAKWYAAADRVVVNTPLHLERLRERFPLAEERVLVIPNGFRDDDRAHATTSRPPGPVSEDRPLRIGYLGVLSKPANAWEVFLEGLSSAVGGGSRIRFEIWGAAEPAVRRRAERLEIGNAVVFHEPRPHAEAMRAVASCDALLVAVAPTHAHLVHQKLYNYLALDRHVLAVAPAASMVARIVDETGAGTVVDPEPAAVGEALRDMAERLNLGDLDPVIDEEARARYARSSHARTLSQLFRRLVASHG